MNGRNPKYRDIPPARCCGYDTLAQRSAVHVTPRAVYVLPAGGVGGVCRTTVYCSSQFPGMVTALRWIRSKVSRTDRLIAVADTQYSADTLYFVATGL